VETASFAALLAAGGVAVGMAWSGLLANFAAGAFLMILRPFKVGDFISAGGATGTVRSIGLFATTIDTPDNIRTVVGNNKLLSDNIQNFSANPYRRVELTAQLAHGVDHNEAIHLLRTRIGKIAKVLTNPAPDLEIPDVQPCRTGAGGQTLLSAKRLLAGLLRNEQGDSRKLQRSGLSGSPTPPRAERHGCGSRKIVQR
jgi:small conductance mechanosensitive channel